MSPAQPPHDLPHEPPYDAPHDPLHDAGPDGPAAPPAAESAPKLPSWPRRPKRLATAVVEDLVDRIVGRELPEGSALPIEPVLCEMFAVSRTVIREAVKSLEAMRLVHAQQGHGTRVRSSDEWDLLNPVVLAASVRHDAELSILEDMVATRRALESEMAGQAADRADARQLRRIEAAFALMLAEEHDPARFLRADLEFHDTIMVASGNRVGRAVVRTINAEAFRSLRYIGETTVKDCQDSNAEHRLIWERVQAHDPEGAARAMNDHILRSWLHRRPTPPAARAADSGPGSGSASVSVSVSADAAGLDGGSGPADAD
ncbi:FadR/GntR family transcriptional regulator [Actinacidiphila acididurans]|uniref:FadR family transcriptional regulator n=1 Tax=Actinacidiphila acididurans TaxID=2784346 RepID=A0ABS2TWK5_9ACTN|nr:FadR/GntR family transcriptional regulator [Actinacidiphila acididurans]MBM9506348.1 FadR family transcriptional regulator [Actinacidiphila acididurans]